MRVLHYQRRKRPDANYSLEFVFQDIRDRLADRCEIVCRYSPYFSNGVLRRAAIIRDVYKHQFPVTHVTGDINFAILGAKRSSAILTILDCGFLQRTHGLRRLLLKKFWLDWPVKWARKITTISESAKSEIVQFSGCDPGKIEVIPVAISEQFTKSEFNFRENSPRILVLGTKPNKNVDRIIQAVSGMECTLTLIGPISSSLTQELKRAGIKFENKLALTQSEILNAYVESDMLCFASTHEGFGMPILEAQAVGRPVVTSNCSSMPEVAGDAACFVDPLDVGSIRAGIARVIAEPNYRNNLITRGYSNVKRFDGQAIAERYLRLYESLC